MNHLLRVGRIRGTVSVLAVAAWGCSPGVQPVVVPVPEPWTSQEIEGVGALLALEDRRGFDLPAIASASASPSPRIRTRAALTAARTAPVDARPFPRLLLADEDTAVAATAAFAVGQMRDTAAVEQLAVLLAEGSRRPTVGIEAAAALGRIGTPRAREILRAVLLPTDTQRLAPDPVLAESITAAWRAGEDEVEPFARWLDHPNPEIRWRVAYALSRPPRAAAGTILWPLLQDSVPFVRAVALRGLSSSAVVSAGAAREQALAMVLPLLGDSSYHVRIEAVRALGSYDETASVEALVDELNSGTPHESVVALEALARIGPAARAGAASIGRLVVDPGVASHLREQAVRALASVEPTALQALEEGLSRDPDWRVRSALATAIAPRRAAALQILRILARDRDPRVAAGSVSAMAEAFDPASLAEMRPLLVELLLTTDVHVRAAALEALSTLADPTTFPALLDAYDVAQRDVQNDAALAALEAIASMRSSGVSPERAFFARFGRHEDHLVRLRAVALFGQSALQAWGPALPLDTGKSEQTYRELVSRWVDRPGSGTDRPRVSIQSESGAIVIELFAETSPLTVANFLDLVGIGYFDGQQWPRVVPNFVVQGGDPRGDTSGGPGYSIRDELNRHRFGTGSLGMALSGPDTGGSQFFLTHSPQPHLDGGYTVFGSVVSGQAILEGILPGERIVSIRIIEDGAYE